MEIGKKKMKISQNKDIFEKSVIKICKVKFVICKIKLLQGQVPCTVESSRLTTLTCLPQTISSPFSSSQAEINNL